MFVPQRHVLGDPGDHRELARLIAQAAQEVRSTPRAPFSWPEDRPCGLDPYYALVDQILAEKGLA